MNDEEIIARVTMLLNEKIITRQPLNEDEYNFINEVDFWKYLEDGKITEQFYATCLIGVLGHPSFKNMGSWDKAEDIRTLRELNFAKEVLDYKDGYNFNEYERILFYLVNNPAIGLSDYYKASLINEVENIQYRSVCLNQLGLSKETNDQILDYLKNEGIASREEYYNILYNISINENSEIHPCLLMSRIKEAKEYKGDEVNTEHDIAYNNLVYMICCHAKKDRVFSKTELLSATNDKEFLMEVITNHYNELGLTDYDRIVLIAKIADKEYIDALLKGEIDIGLGKDWKPKLIEWNSYKAEDKQAYYLQYVSNDEYKLSEFERVSLILSSASEEYAQEFLENNSLSTINQALILGAVIRDKDYIDKYISSKEEPFKMWLNDEYIKIYGTSEEKEAWNSKIIEVTDISKLSLDQIPADGMIRIVGENTAKAQQQLYTKETMEKILSVVDKNFGDIEPAKIGDKESELVTFLEVYNRLRTIVYDDYAISKQAENDYELQITSRNLQGGLLENRCVCAGYAEILRNVLAMKNIEAKFISGFSEIEDEVGHAWNQVKIGEEWFNVDLTWDRDRLVEMGEIGKKLGPEVLKTDKEFENHNVFSRYRSANEEKCETNLREYMSRSSLENDLANEREAVSKDIGNQVKNMVEANGITVAEFANQAKQIQQM